ncbi:unnamed protein product [Brachionus calyciflorus]|nr:unnamed protein product [Brachionus calyciflorus]
MNRRRTKDYEQVLESLLKEAKKIVFEEENKAKNLEKFLDYLVDNYFEGSFPIELWNHFDSEGPRTNNNLEAYNNKLKSFVGIANTNIFKAIDVFQKQESAAFLKYQHALIGKPAPPRKKLQIFKDEQLRSYKKMFLENDLTLDAHIKYVIPLFIFRKTKSLNGNDSDESDSENEELVASSDEEDTLET